MVNKAPQIHDCLITKNYLLRPEYGLSVAVLLKNSFLRSGSIYEIIGTSLTRVCRFVLTNFIVQNWLLCFLFYYFSEVFSQNVLNLLTQHLRPELNCKLRNHVSDFFMNLVLLKVGKKCE